MLAFASPADWESWLDKHHTEPSGAWLQFAKKGSGAITLTYIEARDSAIAYGWIDGLINKYDETYYLIRFTPRNARSGWSKVNREVAEGLITAGRMRPAGLLHVETAKRDGRWDLAYDSQSTMTVPDDFSLALEHNATASEYFATLSAANRYAFLYRLQTAKRPELRAARMEKFVAMLEAGECFHP
jgi:uncharacterized protein YdeI (YjbR/CyaY-like superfamily)